MTKSVADQLRDILEEYEEELKEEAAAIAQETAKETRKVLKRTSPRSKSSPKHYADGWAVKTTRVPGGGLSATVYNRTKPQLTHLLEYGHVKAGGGRVRAIPHIKKAETAGIKLFVQRLEDRL